MSEEKNLNNRILDLRTRSCDLCLFGDIGEFELAYAKRQLSIKELLEQLKVRGVEISKYKWYNHIKLHVNPEVSVVLSENAPVLASEIVDKISECVEAIEDLKAQQEKTSLSLNSELDPSMLKAYTGLQAETRHWIELLAKLTGDFKDTTNIKVNNLHIEYTNVAGIVLQEACAICRPKLAAKLEPIILKKNEN